jgi:hypothetical protein
MSENQHLKLELKCEFVLETNKGKVEPLTKFKSKTIQ